MLESQNIIFEQIINQKFFGIQHKRLFDSLY